MERLLASQGKEQAATGGLGQSGLNSNEGKYCAYLVMVC